MTRTREENAADLAAEPIRIRAEAIKAALEYGYKYNETGELCAPLGKFECEPYYALYFYDAVLDGGTVRSSRYSMAKSATVTCWKYLTLSAPRLE